MKVHQQRHIALETELGAFIISRICRGLEYAHNKSDSQAQPLNIVHRDVSPRSILINHEGVVKLTDFGIAKAARVMEQREGRVLMGKAAYMLARTGPRRGNRPPFGPFLSRSGDVRAADRSRTLRR